MVTLPAVPPVSSTPCASVAAPAMSALNRIFTVNAVCPSWVSGISLNSAVKSSASSSRMVNSTSSGPATPAAPTSPDTVISRSAVSTVSSAAVTVTVPVLAVASAAKLRVVFELRLKSDAVAGLTGDAVTSTVKAVSEAGSAAAVTVAAPLSATAAGLSPRNTVGNSLSTWPSTRIFITFGVVIHSLVVLRSRRSSPIDQSAAESASSSVSSVPPTIRTRNSDRPAPVTCR